VSTDGDGKKKNMGEVGDALLKLSAGEKGTPTQRAAAGFLGGLLKFFGSLPALPEDSLFNLPSLPPESAVPKKPAVSVSKKPTVGKRVKRTAPNAMPAALTGRGVEILTTMRAANAETAVFIAGPDLVLVHFRCDLEAGENAPLSLTWEQARALAKNLNIGTMPPLARTLHQQMQQSGNGVTIFRNTGPGPGGLPTPTGPILLVSRDVIEAGCDKAIEFTDDGAHKLGHVLLNLTGGCGAATDDAHGDAERMGIARGIAESLLREPPVADRPGVFMPYEPPDKKQKQ